jgi:hypothetical protein
MNHPNDLSTQAKKPQSIRGKAFEEMGILGIYEWSGEKRKKKVEKIDFLNLKYFEGGSQA